MWKRLRERYRTQRLFRWAVELGVVLVVVGVVGAVQTRHHPRGEMPPVSLRTLDGAPVSFATYAGKPTLVAVWAPWCGVCQAESDNLSRAARMLGGATNVVTVAAGFGEVSQVRQTAERWKLETPVLLAGDDFTRAMHIDAFPTLFVLDSQGRIVGSEQGYTTTLGLVARGLWAR